MSSSSNNGGPTRGGDKQTPLKAEPGKGGRQKWQQQFQQCRYRKLVVKQPKFKGRCEELKGCIYDCSDPRQADMFAKTTKEVAEYASWMCKYSANIRKAIESLKELMIVPPADPPAGAMATQTRIGEKKIDAFVKWEVIYEQNRETMYSVILGQNTDAMRAKLESLDDYERVADELDAIELLKLIHSIAFNFQSQKYEALSVHEAICHFYTQRQEKHMTCQAYLEQLNNHKEVVEHCGSIIGAHPRLIRRALEDMEADPDMA